MLISIAISTVYSDLQNVIEKLLLYTKLISSSDVGFVVVCQCSPVDEEYLIDGIRVIQSTDVGLSKSRNLAIKNCAAEWLWFQDGDVDLIVNNCHGLFRMLAEYKGDLLLVKVASLENPNAGYKDYERYNVSRWALPFRVSSIEIIVRKEFLIESEIRFDERLGLGTALPSCEENLFCYDLLVKHRASYALYDWYVCRHTTLPVGRNINYKERYIARGYMLGRVASILGLSLLAWWSVRPTLDGVPRFSRAKNMLLGFFSSRFRGNSGALK